MASKRGNGWRARYRKPDGSMGSRTFRTKTAAEQFERQTRTDQERGTWIDPKAGDLTFATFAQSWLATKMDVRDGTLENIESRLTVHLLPYFGHLRMNKIAPSDVLAWQVQAKGTRSPATLNGVLGTLRQVFDLAELDGLIPRNPAAHVKPLPNAPRKEIHPLTVAQAAAVADAIEPRFRAAILFDALGSGLRAGELWALRVDRVDWLRGVVRVTESVDETKSGLVTSPPKNGKAQVLRVDSASIEILAEHVRQYPSSTGLLFTSSEDRQVRHRNFMRRAFGPALLKVEGLPDGFRFHDLRHTHASLLIQRGWRPDQVKDRLGHGSIRTTLDTYGHLFPGHDDEQLANFAGVVQAALAPTERAHSVPIAAEVLPLKVNQEPG